jgi:exo-beta-1,3-glucanase (GH17 family)
MSDHTPKKPASRLEAVFSAPTPEVDFNKLARYVAGTSRSAEERAEVERQAAGSPAVAAAVGLDERVPPPVPPPASPGFGWRGALLSLLVLVCSAVIHRAVSEFNVSDGLSALDSLAAARNQQWRWGLIIGGALAVVGLVVFAAVSAGYRRLGRLRYALPVGLFLFAVVVLLSIRSVSAEVRDTRGRLDQMFLSHQWVAYESPRLRPKEGVFPTVDEIREELRVLRERGGFDALITFSSDGGALAEVPRIAKEEFGFKAVIQGISLPEWRDAAGNRADTEAIFRQQLKQLGLEGDAPRNSPPNAYVDAYCVGHNVSNRVSIERLAGWIAEVRAKSGKPVGTTTPLYSLLGPQNQAVREIGDFYFPDVNGGWSVGTTPQSALSQLRQDLYRVGELTDKPVLLKMISYPSAGRECTPEAQLEFFRGVSTFVVPPRGVYLSVFAGFDLPWKTPPDFDVTEQHVGLFAVDLEAGALEKRYKSKPALAVLRGGFLVQNRP